MKLSKAAIAKAASKGIRIAKTACAENAPAIMAAVAVISVAGVVASTFLATKKATRVYDQMCRQSEQEPAKVEVVKKTAKYYIPTAIFATTAVASIVGAHHVNAKKAAALSALLSMSEDSLKEYKAALSEEQRKEVQTKIAEKGLEKTMPKELQNMNVAHTDGGFELFFEPLTGRYFYSSAAEILNQVGAVNLQLGLHDTCSVNEWFGMIGLQDVEIGDDIGWTCREFMRVSFDSKIWCDKPVMVIVYENAPTFAYRDW